MSDAPQITAESASAPASRRGRWVRTVALMASAFFATATGLQIEAHQQQAETLRVLGPVGASGSGAAGSHPRGRWNGAAAGVQPVALGALHEAPATGLQTLPGEAGGFAPSTLEFVAADPDGAIPASGRTNATPASFSGPSLFTPSGPIGTAAPSPPTSGGLPTTGPVLPPITGLPLTSPPAVTSPPVVPPPIVVAPPTGTLDPPTDPQVVAPPIVTALPPIDPSTGGPEGPTEPSMPGVPGPSGPQPATPLAAAPEPSTWLDLIVGLGLTGAALRRRASGRRRKAWPAG
jgi:hypothetical protein